MNYLLSSENNDEYFKSSSEFFDEQRALKACGLDVSVYSHLMSLFLLAG